MGFIKLFFAYFLINALISFIFVKTLRFLIVNKQKFKGIFYYYYDYLVNKILNNVEKELNEDIFEELKNKLDERKRDIKESLKEKIIFVIDKNLSKFKLNFLLKTGIETAIYELIDLLFDKYFNKKEEILEKLKEKKLGTLVKNKLEVELRNNKELFFNFLNKVVDKIERFLIYYSLLLSFLFALVNSLLTLFLK